jgi:hypothetical protein
MQIGGPTRIRCRAQEREHAAEPTTDREAHEQQRADVETRELRGVDGLSGGNVRCVLDLEQAQMLESRLDPRELVEAPLLEHCRVTRRERGATRVDLCERRPSGVEPQNGDRIGAAGVGQGLQASRDSLVGGLVRDTLEVDRNFGADQVQAGRPRSTL